MRIRQDPNIGAQREHRAVRRRFEAHYIGLNEALLQPAGGADRTEELSTAQMPLIRTSSGNAMSTPLGDDPSSEYED